MRDKNNKISTNPSNSICAKKYLGVIFLYSPHTGGFGAGAVVAVQVFCGLCVLKRTLAFFLV